MLRREPYEEVAALVLAPGEIAHAPFLLDVEVAQVFLRLERAGTLAAEPAIEALHDLRDLRLVRHGHSTLIDRAWALRHDLTVYDAVYIALAEALEAPLVTTDRRLASAPGHDAEVRLCV